MQLSVLSRTVADPPGSPQEGDRYIVAAPATGDWTGMEAAVAAFQDGIWRFYSPMPGWRVWISDEARFLVHDATQWRGVIADADLQDVAELGINATADATNKLAVKSPGVLFDNIGNDSQVKVNKAAAGDTASHLFQTGYSGRAEFGLTGDDDFHAKVSPDGAAWNDGLLIDKSSGRVTFPSGIGEQGTWTPTVTFSTPGDFSPTYSAQQADYIGLGDWAYVSFYVKFDTNAYTTAGGYLRLDGLPFASRVEGTLQFFPCGNAITTKVVFLTAYKQVMWVTRTGFTWLTLMSVNSGGGTSSLGVPTQFPASTAGFELWGSFWYRRS